MSKNDDYKEHQDCGCIVGPLSATPCSGRPKSMQKKNAAAWPSHSVRMLCTFLRYLADFWVNGRAVGSILKVMVGPLKSPSHVHVLHVQVSQVYGKSLGVISKHTKNQWKSQMLTENPNGIPLFNIMFNILIENPDWNSNFHGTLLHLSQFPTNEALGVEDGSLRRASSQREANGGYGYSYSILSLTKKNELNRQ